MKTDRDGTHSLPVGMGGRSPIDGKYRGCQSRLRLRAQRVAQLGPSRRIVWIVQDAQLELLECGHTGPLLPIDSYKKGYIFRRCAKCRDGVLPDTQSVRMTNQ